MKLKIEKEEIFHNGCSLKRKGEFQEAIEYFMLYEGWNGNRRFLTQLAICELELKNYDKAIEYSEKSLKIAKKPEKETTAMNVKGRALLGLGRIEEAKVEFLKCFKCNPENNDCQKELEKLGDPVRTAEGVVSATKGYLLCELIPPNIDIIK